MAIKSVSEMASNWQQGFGSQMTASKYVKGIDRYTDNPMTKAAAADTLYLERVQQAVASGRRAESLNKPREAWAGPAKSIGAQRLASGAQKGLSKYTQALQSKWHAVYQQVHDAVQSMPKGTREAAKARSAAAIDIMMAAAGR